MLTRYLYNYQNWRKMCSLQCFFIKYHDSFYYDDFSIVFCENIFFIISSSVLVCYYIQKKSYDLTGFKPMFVAGATAPIQLPLWDCIFILKMKFNKSWLSDTTSLISCIIYIEIVHWHYGPFFYTFSRKSRDWTDQGSSLRVLWFLDIILIVKPIPYSSSVPVLRRENKIK